MGSWRRWWAIRRLRRVYRSETQRLDREIERAQSTLDSIAGQLARARRQLAWGQDVRPREVPLATVEGETGLAVVTEVTLLEMRRRHGNDVWVPVDVGAIYLTDRRLTFLGSKKVDFEFDLITTTRITPVGLLVEMSTRNRGHVLEGPSQRIATLIAACRAVGGGLMPTDPFRSRVTELRASLEVLLRGLEGARSLRSALTPPLPALSPGWIPTGLLLIAMVTMGLLGHDSPAGEPEVAARTVTRTTTGTTSATGVSASSTTSTLPPSRAVALLTMEADPPGDDADNLNGEYVRLENEDDDDVDMTDWALEDAANHRYLFPPGFVLPAGAEVTVHSGCGTDDHESLYWCHDRPVWNDDRDTASLFDRNGRMVDSLSYVAAGG